MANNKIKLKIVYEGKKVVGIYSNWKADCFEEIEIVQLNGKTIEEQVELWADVTENLKNPIIGI